MPANDDRDLAEETNQMSNREEREKKRSNAQCEFSGIHLFIYPDPGSGIKIFPISGRLGNLAPSELEGEKDNLDPSAEECGDELVLVRNYIMKKLSCILMLPVTIALLASCTTTVKEPAATTSTTTTSSEQVQTPAASTTTTTHQTGNY